MNRHFTPFHHHHHIFMLLTWWPVLVAGFLSLELNLALLLRQAFWKTLHTAQEQHRTTQRPLWKLCFFRAICSSHCLLHWFNSKGKQGREAGAPLRDARPSANTLQAPLLVGMRPCRGEREEYYMFHFPITVTALKSVERKGKKELVPISPAETLAGQPNTVG